MSKHLRKLAFAVADDLSWRAYGGDAGLSRQSKLAQITPANVAYRRVAWTYRSGEVAPMRGRTVRHGA